MRECNDISGITCSNLEARQRLETTPGWNFGWGLPQERSCGVCHGSTACGFAADDSGVSASLRLRQTRLPALHEHLIYGLGPTKLPRCHKPSSTLPSGEVITPLP